MQLTAHKYENHFYIAVTKFLIKINHISHKIMSCSKGNEMNTKDTANEQTHEYSSQFVQIIGPTECITEIINESRFVSELPDSLVNDALRSKCSNVERISLPRSTNSVPVCCNYVEISEPIGQGLVDLSSACDCRPTIHYRVVLPTESQAAECHVTSSCPCLISSAAKQEAAGEQLGDLNSGASAHCHEPSHAGNEHYHLIIDEELLLETISTETKVIVHKCHAHEQNKQSEMTKSQSKDSDTQKEEKAEATHSANETKMNVHQSGPAFGKLLNAVHSPARTRRSYSVDSGTAASAKESAVESKARDNQSAPLHSRSNEWHSHPKSELKRHKTLIHLPASVEANVAHSTTETQLKNSCIITQSASESEAQVSQMTANSIDFDNFNEITPESECKVLVSRCATESALEAKSPVSHVSGQSVQSYSTSTSAPEAALPNNASQPAPEAKKQVLPSTPDSASDMIPSVSSATVQDPKLQTPNPADVRPEVVTKDCIHSTADSNSDAKVNSPHSGPVECQGKDSSTNYASISSDSTNSTSTNSASAKSTSTNTPTSNSTSVSSPSTNANSITANCLTSNSGSVSVASSSSHFISTHTSLNGTDTTPISSSTNTTPASSNCGSANDSTCSKPELTNSFIHFSAETTSDTKMTHLKCNCIDCDSLTYYPPESDRLVSRSITLSITEEMHAAGTQNVDDLTIDVVIVANSDVPTSGDSAGRTGDTRPSIHLTPGKSNSFAESGLYTPNPSTVTSFLDDSNLDGLPKPKMSSTPKVNITHNVPSSPTATRKRYCSPTHSSLMREQATKPKSDKCNAHHCPSAEQKQCANVGMTSSPRVRQPPKNVNWTPRVKRHSCISRQPVRVSTDYTLRSMPAKCKKEAKSTDSLERTSYPQAPFLSSTPRFDY